MRPTIVYRGETWRRKNCGSWVSIHYIGGGDYTGRVATGEAARIMDMIYEATSGHDVSVPEKASQGPDTARKRTGLIQRKGGHVRSLKRA